VFNLSNVENKIHVAPIIFEYKLPLNSSMVNQTTTIVKAPNKVGKNLTQNTLFPRILIINEIQEVKGRTDVNPNAR